MSIYRRFSITMLQAQVIKLGLVTLIAEIEKIQAKEKDPYWEYMKRHAEETLYLLDNYDWRKSK